MKRKLSWVAVAMLLVGFVATGTALVAGQTATGGRLDLTLWHKAKTVELSGGQKASSTDAAFLFVDPLGVRLVTMITEPIYSVEVGPDGKPLNVGYDPTILTPLWAGPRTLAGVCCGFGLLAFWAMWRLRMRRSPRGFPIEARAVADEASAT